MSKSKLARATKDHYTLSEIERAFKNKEKLLSYAMSGDMDSVHLLVDAENALKQSNPTEIQERTLDLVYRQGLSLAEAGKQLGVSLQAVKFNLDLLRVKIKKVLDQWKQMDREDEVA